MKRTGRFIVVLDGPAKNKDETHVIQCIHSDDDDWAAHVYTSLEQARRRMRGHIMKPFVAWVLDVDTGDTHDL